MPKRKPAPKATKPPTESGKAIGIVLKALLALGLVALMIGGLGYLGRKAGEAVSHLERYAVPVSSIQLTPPPGQERLDFLTEVRFQSHLPDRVQAVAPDLKDTLTAAFRKHPWVEDVLSVSVDPDRTIRMELVYRKPVLALKLLNDPTLRATDSAGVLLPLAAKTDGLPVLVNVQPAAVIPGQPFPGTDVKRAAELVTTYPTKLIERTKDGWRLTAPDGKMRAIVSDPR